MRRFFTVGVFLLSFFALFHTTFVEGRAAVEREDIPRNVTRKNAHLFKTLSRSLTEKLEQTTQKKQEKRNVIARFDTTKNLASQAQSPEEAYVDIVLTKAIGAEVRFGTDVPDNQIEGLEFVRVIPDPEGGSHDTRIYRVLNQKIRVKSLAETPLRIVDVEETGIVSFDASHCPTLEEFYANRNPDLAVLDFSHNPYMKTIAAAFTKVNKVNVKGLKFLSVFSVAPAQLSELDVTGCDNLSFLLVFGNQIKDEKMAQLIASLPDLSENDERGMLFVIDENPVTFEENNRCSVAHVNAAVKKDWGVFNESRQPYKGYDYAPNYSDDIITFNTNIAQNASIFMRIEGKDNADVLVDGAEYWQRESERDEYILKKKQVTIKGKVAYLDISGCEITDLNISGNKHLTTIRCANNPMLKKLDVSQHKDLKELDITQTNIFTLDLSQAENLKVLKCSTSKIGSLDLSKTPLLQELNISNNDIRQIDLSHAPLLKELTVSGCSLTELDLSKNPLLESIQAHANELTKLLFVSDQLYRVTVFANKIKGEAMTAMMQSLPVVQDPDRQAYIAVFYEGTDMPESNICMETDVEIAREKRWKVTKVDADYEESEYGGVTGCAPIYDLLKTAIYPNPAQEYIIVSGVERGDRVELLTVEGVTLWKTLAEQNSVHIDLATVPAGWYLLQTAKGTHLLQVTK